MSMLAGRSRRGWRAVAGAAVPTGGEDGTLAPAGSPRAALGRRLGIIPPLWKPHPEQVHIALTGVDGQMVRSGGGEGGAPRLARVGGA